MSVKKAFSLFAFVFVFAATAAIAAPPPQSNARFPTLDDQLKKAHAKKGSALEKLIRDNQDFTKLKDKDADDPIVPPWLKVYWRKGHPEVDYDKDDPTGGYP